MTSQADKPHTPRQEIGKRARLGMMLVMLATVIAKLSALASQFALGWFLSPEHFAVYAIAIAYAAMLTSIKNGGVEKILIQRGAEYSKIAPSVVSCALSINILLALAIAIGSFFISEYYNESELKNILLIIAISIPLGTYSLILQAKLSIDLKFKELTKVSVISAIIKHSSMVLFAYLGLGALSFVLPLIITAIIETLLCWYFIRTIPTLKGTSWSTIKNILYSTKWIIIAAVLTALNIHGDYFVLSFFVDKSSLGIYFFAVQLTYGISAILAYSLRTVMFPVFSNLNSDFNRAKKAYLKTVGAYSLVCSFACVLFIASAPELIHIMWNGKWDSTIPIVQIFAFSLIVRLLMSLNRVVLESQGMWKLVTIFLFIDGAGTLVAAYIGSSFNDINIIALCVGIYRVLLGIIYNAIAARKMGISHPQSVFLNLPIFGISLSVILIVAFIDNQLSLSTYFALISKVFITIMLFSSLAIIFQRNNIKLLTDSANEIYGKISRNRV